MKKIAIALATVLSLTSIASAGTFAEALAAKQAQDKASITLIDSKQSAQDSRSTSSQPRLGYEGSPWFITNM